MSPRPDGVTAHITGPVLLVVAGGAVSQAAIARTAELAAGAPVTVVGVGSHDLSRTDSASSRSAHPAGEARRRVVPSPESHVRSSLQAAPPSNSAALSSRASLAGARRGTSSRASLAGDLGGKSSRANTEPEQVRRTVALAMSVLENTGVMATGHIAVTGSPARAVARMARVCGARVVILDQSGPSAGERPVPSGGADMAGRGTSGRGGAVTIGLMAELRRRMYGSGVVVLAETARRGGWVSA